MIGTSLVVQWLRFHTPNVGDPGSIPGQGTRSHMPQQRLKIPNPPTKTWYSQINKYILKKKKNDEKGFLYQILHYKARVTEAVVLA